MKEARTLHSIEGKTSYELVTVKMLHIRRAASKDPSLKPIHR
jgi:hypothetical protein